MKLIFLLIFISSHAASQTKDQVIEKYLTAIGGKDNWLAVRDQAFDEE